MYNENVMPGITTGIAVGALPGVLSPPGRGSENRTGMVFLVKYFLRTMYNQLAGLIKKTGSSLEAGGELYENGKPRYRVLRNTLK